MIHIKKLFTKAMQVDISLMIFTLIVFALAITFPAIIYSNYMESQRNKDLCTAAGYQSLKLDSNGRGVVCVDADGILRAVPDE